MMPNESTLMLHTAPSGSSTNQLELDFTDPQDLFSYKTVLKKLLLGKKGNFPHYPRQKLILLSSLLVKHRVLYGLSLVRRVGLVREQLNIMIRICLLFRVGDLSAPEIVNAEFLTSEKHFTNARADHRKRTVPSVKECNSLSMGFAWGSYAGF